MSRTDTLKSIIDLAVRENIQLDSCTIEAQKELDNPAATISLVGCFQVGKSTLLNRAFLKEELLLKQGDGRCTTAVMTKLVYGAQKRLTVFYRDEQRPQDVYDGDAVTSELIERLTTVDEPDETIRQSKRTEIAQTIRYIQIEYPCEALKQYTFYDTPGIDDPNQELIQLTTLEFLAETDLILLVVDASTTLNLYVKQFLSQSVFENGIGRVMVMASCRPTCPQAAARKLILQSIQAELSNMGRGYIPVVSFTFDPELDGDVLHGSTEIQPAVLEYIDKNKRTAREERLTLCLRNDFIAACEKIKAHLLTSSQSEAERQALNDKINAIVQEMDFHYKKTIDDFRLEYLKIKSWLESEIQEKFLDDFNPESILNQFMMKIEQSESLEDVRKQADIAAESIKISIDAVVLNLRKEVARQTTEVLKKTSQDVALASEKCRIDTQWDASAVNTGWSGKIHPTLIRVGEVVLGYFVLQIPGALIVLFGKKIPFLKNILPTVFMKNVVLNTVKKSMAESLEVTKKDILHQFGSSQEGIEKEIKNLFQEMFRTRIQPYQDALKSAPAPLSAEEQKNLESMIQEYQIVIENLNSILF